MKKKFLTAGIFAALFICLTISLSIFDIAAVGPESSKVGLSHINNATFQFFGTSRAWDKITDVLIVIAIVSAIALVGFLVYQAIKRKKVNPIFYPLAGLYAATGVFYLLFEKIIKINCRPVLEEGKLAVSYPSTHTLIACVLMWSSAVMLGKIIKDIRVRRVLQTLCIVISLLIAYGRIFAGMHWITDVHGSFLLAGALVFAFWGALDCEKLAKKHGN